MKNSFFEFLRVNAFAIACLLLAVLLGILFLTVGFWGALLVAALGALGFFIGWCIDRGKSPIRVINEFLERLRNE